MHTDTSVIIAVLRVAAVVVMLFTVMALWNFMQWLPWQIDCLIAAVASLAFAYKFERGDER